MRYRPVCVTTVVIFVVAVLAACSEPMHPDNYQIDPSIQGRSVASTPCRSQNPRRNAYFGDTHVHTAYSADAWMFGVRVTPEQAHRYAFGGEVELPVEGDDRRAGARTRSARIDRPLDFVAITDHAEYLGELALCNDENADAWSTRVCQSIRNGRGRSLSLVSLIMLPSPFRYDSVCGADGQRCRDAAGTLWQDIVATADRWNDDSENCERTAFIAYEYSSFRLGANLHRNVIFRNSMVPRLPVSYVEAPREWDLWAMLKQSCIDSGSGCDVLAIPHNSNVSAGRMFNVDYIGAATPAEQAARNQLRMQIEPIVEVMQHKGDSECRNGVPGVLGSEDELCDFEKMDTMGIAIRKDRTVEEDDRELCPSGRIADIYPHLGSDCISHLSFTRYALIEGLREEQRVGVNPFKFGLSAATDTHNGMAGGVEERSYPGHLGIGDDTIADRSAWSTVDVGNTANNPGGLFGVWAEQNNRDAIFNAMRRKEVFGTSGPRIKPRLFGGFGLPGDICEREDRIEIADQLAVPMGGDLDVARVGEQAPSFFLEASADPGTADAPGMPLQRLQMIKGWVDADGNLVERVYDVAGDPNNGATVDIDSCATRGDGFGQLCAVWQDPDFDKDRPAVYYMRAIENPSCRYNAWQCAGLKGRDRPASCDDVRSPKVIQERAWTSPIWYTPQT